MDRRRFVELIGGIIVAPLARAQQPRRTYRVAHVSINSLEARSHLNEALELGLHEQGYRIGQDLILLQVAANGSIERLHELVRKTVASEPDVIVTGANVVTLAVKNVTQRIPIVMTIGVNVVESGVVQSLRRPGANVTGMSVDVGDGIAAKQVELLKELLPGISHIGVLWEPPLESYRTTIDKAAAALGLGVTWVRYSGDLDRDFADLQRARCNALDVLGATGIYRRAVEVSAYALRLRLPSVWGLSDFVAAGGLMSYGPNLADLYRRAARHVHQILKGAWPGEIAVEQPTRIDLEINMKSAKVLGIKVPQSLLLRADRVIE